MSILSFILGLSIGVIATLLIVRWWWARSEVLDTNTWNSQQLVLMYFISNEVYRARFLKWAKTDQAYRYAYYVAKNFAGKLYLLPIENSAQIEAIIEKMAGTEHVDSDE